MRRRRKGFLRSLSFTLAGILSRKFMFFFALRKKSSSHFLVLKTHATPISAHFGQNTPKNVRKKTSQGKFFSQNFVDGLRGQKNTKQFWEKISLGKEMGNELP